METIVNKTFDRLVDKALDEGKKLFWLFLYFWVLFGLFSVYRSLVLTERNLIYHQGFAVINALLLAKVVLVAEFFQVANNLKHKPLVYPIVFKSAVFSVILICFYFIEETLSGVWHGKSIAASFPEIGGEGWKGILVVGTILFVVLIPLFAYREIARVLGKDELHSLIFTRGPDAVLIRPPQLGQARVRAEPRTDASNE
jgi:hypothetical protein